MDPKLVDACAQFEAVFLHPLLEALKLGRVPHTLAQDDDGEAGAAGSDDLMQSMFTDALALALARQGGIGLGRELTRMFRGLRP